MFISDIDSTQRNQTITSLDPRTSYTFEVQALSVDGRVSSYSPLGEILTLPPGMPIIALRSPPPHTHSLTRVFLFFIQRSESFY